MFFTLCPVSSTYHSISLTDEGNLTSLQATARGLSLALSYLEQGVTFSDKGFFQVVINLLGFAAQLDPKDEPSATLRAYNAPEDYTLFIGPTSAAASDRLPWSLLIPALGYLPSEMLAQRPGGRWAELSGIIKFDGAYIGRVRILKGGYTQSTPDSCGTTALDSGIDMVENSSSLNMA